MHERRMRSLGDYTLLESLGSSELGAVHLAAAGPRKEACFLEILDDEVAADGERVAAMLLEVAASRRLVHPSIDAVLGAGRAVSPGGAERVWIARPAVEGWSLAALLDYADRVSELLLVQVSVWVTAELAEAVEAAHRLGLIHGALAPPSVRLSSDAHVHLRDLGLGSLLGGSERRLAFRAPELLLSDVMTPRVDVYGLGMILLTCLMGQPPFARHDPLATRRAVLEHRLPRVRAARPALSPRVDALVAQLCALDPERRPGSPREVAHLLRELLGPSEPLVPAVLERQLLRVPPERALDPAAVRRARKRLGAETQSEAGPGARAPSKPRTSVRSGRARVAGAGLELPRHPRIGRFSLDVQVEVDGPIAVYQAVDLDAAAPVRLRVLDPSFDGQAGALPADVWLELFEQEAALAATVGHPCILRFRDAGEAEGSRWIAYAPPPETTLAARIASARPLDARAALLDVARAVDHLHGRGILASGLGTRSVRVSSRGLAVFSDLSRVAPVGGALHPRLEEDPFALTPELAAARRHEPASDLFLLGVLAYELLTGTRPFRGLDAWSILEALRTRHPRAPAELDPRLSRPLSDLTMRLLERDPARRPGSAREVADELESLPRH